MSDNLTTARQIADDLLRRTGDALLSEDFEDFVGCFHIPTVVISADGENILETREDLKRVFISVRSAYKRMGVTEMVRHTLAASFDDPETIKTSHETRLVNETRLVEDPYPAISTLKFIGGTWVITKSEYAVPASAKPLSEALGRGAVDP